MWCSSSAHNSKRRKLWRKRETARFQSSETSSDSLVNTTTRAPTAASTLRLQRTNRLIRSHLCCVLVTHATPLCWLGKRWREGDQRSKYAERHATRTHQTHLFQCTDVTIHSFRVRGPSHVPRLRHSALQQVSAGRCRQSQTQPAPKIGAPAFSD